MAREVGADPAQTRRRIIDAAGELARAGDGARVTVRAVALRAGVGIGTLRYHFPTQRELLDATLASIYEEAMPDDRIRDSSIPARDRLQECLLRLLAPVGLGERAREVWSELFHSFIDPASSPDTRAGYRELSRQAALRIESWLSILTEEGAIRAGDNAARARFLLTVLNGLSVERALPSDRVALEAETEVLAAAIDHLFED